VERTATFGKQKENMAGLESDGYQPTGCPGLCQMEKGNREKGELSRA